MEAGENTMLSLGLITSNSVAAEAIEQLVEEAGIFRFVGNQSPELLPLEALKKLRFLDPEIILLDLNDWSLIAPIVEHIRATSLRGKLIGFRESWNRRQQAEFEDAGIKQLLREPFSPSQLDEAAHTAVHDGVPETRPNLFAFLPAKAGGGCSTAALNMAVSLGAAPAKRVLVIEADTRSGTFSIALNIKSHHGLLDALQKGDDLTVVDWQQMHATAEGLDLLLADPSRLAPRSSWCGYYQLLRFVDKYYDYVVVDLPEVINDATAEVARAAANVFVVCTPEILSLRLASLRCQEVEAYGVPKERIQVIVTRWTRDGLSLEDVEKCLKRPVYATLSNDYNEVHEAILESRLVSPTSMFGKDCHAVARRIVGAPEEEKSRFGLLRKLAR
jgi:pilus assembly protein CpaE